MKRFLIGLMLVSFLISASPKKEIKEEVGRYQVATAIYVNPKSGKPYIVETIIDTKTGEIVQRKRFYYTKYKKEKRRR
jgi:tRNA U54 and U55 pseudouridine synthase Pus10|tara:strand:- start:696 stop:929 length:234 start_codon:yes stop_codon:yes gene_type:complete